MMPGAPVPAGPVPAGPGALLVDAVGLAAELDSAAPPVVLDVRWRLGGPPGIDSYRAGHIPGAVHVVLDRDLSAPPGDGGRHPLPSAQAFQAAMRAAGVRDDSAVVVYDDGESVPAARAWWNLRYFGHQDVRVLDGGFRAWTAAGLPVTPAAQAGTPAEHGATPGENGVTPGDLTARPGHMPVVDADGAAALASDGVLIDVRAAERYRGETEPIDRVAGHIPGAVNAPIADTGNPDGTFKDPAALAEVFAALGAVPAPGGSAAPVGAPADLAAIPVPGGPAVGAYCGSGVTAARGVLALGLAGIPAALYVGSWSDWTADPSRPIAPRHSKS
jgi:thiosulfate/3-mercaptopyruvate sulfurtransferase